MRRLLVALCLLACVLRAEPAKEFRGVWVATVFNLNWPSKAGLDVAQQQAELRAILDKARELSANGKAVIAVQNDDDRGQIGIIMPGAAVPSGKWGLNVPIAVAARVDRPEASFYGKGINWLFSDPARVTIYVRLQ